MSSLHRRVLLPSLAGLAVVALLVAGILQVFSLRHHSALDDRRSGAVTAARNEIVALLTVSDRTATDDIKDLLEHATAGFHDQLEKRATSFRQAIAAGKVASTGSVTGAGLVSLTRRGAVVAIAARATVRNGAKASAGGARSYRLTVTVQQVGGRWLVSGLTFVV
ncbi:MAG: hypothetical protein M3Y06_12030 [Actinomycetota bacterium]|nr:hypothetical protein [Actinomycetota bacterium]